MKKIMIFAALAAALTLSSCSKEESQNTVTGELRTVNFTTSSYTTKTVFGDKVSNNYPVLWQAGDKVCPSLNFSSPTEATDIPITPVNGGTGASFSGTFATATTYQFFFVSPAAAFKTLSKANNYIGVDIPAGQTSTTASPDPSAQVLFAKTAELTESDLSDPVNLTFNHLSAYLHLTFTNVNLGTAVVNAVNITNDAKKIAGRFYYYVDTGEFVAYSAGYTITVLTSTLSDVWCGLCPVDLSSGELTIEVSTDQGTFTKVVHMPASANLTPGKIAKFTVDMAGVVREDPVVYTAVTSTSQLNVGDKVIIAAADPSLPYALGSTQNSNNRAAAGVYKTADELTDPTNAVEILQLEDGIIPGHYAFRTTSADGYLYAANHDGSLSGNLLRTKNSIDNTASWNISIDKVSTWEKAAIISADIPSSGKGLIRFNSSDKLFTAYGATSSQQAVKLYRLNVSPSTTPRFNATVPDGGAVVGTDNVQVPIYVFGNVAWTASITSGEDASLSAGSGSGNAILTLTIPKSYAADKDYVVTVSTTADVATKSYALNIHHKNAYSFALSKASNNLGTGKNYTSNCDVTIDGIKWNVTGVSNSGSYDGWRMGGTDSATFTNEDRAVYSKTAIPAQVTKVVVKTNATAKVTINSFKVSAHASAGEAASGSNPIGSVSGSFKVGETEFVVPNGQCWSGCYLRIAYNLTKTDTSGKGYVQFGGVTIWGVTSN